MRSQGSITSILSEASALHCDLYLTVWMATVICMFITVVKGWEAFPILIREHPKNLIFQFHIFQLMGSRKISIATLCYHFIQAKSPSVQCEKVIEFALSVGAFVEIIRYINTCHPKARHWTVSLNYWNVSLQRNWLLSCHIPSSRALVAIAMSILQFLTKLDGY